MIKSKKNKEYVSILCFIFSQPIYTTSLGKKVFDLGKKTLQMGSALGVGITAKHYFNLLETQLAQKKNLKALNALIDGYTITIDNEQAQKDIKNYLIKNIIILKDEILITCMITFYKQNNFNIDLMNQYAKKYIELMFYHKTDGELYTDQCFVDVIKSINEDFKKKLEKIDLKEIDTANQKQKDQIETAVKKILDDYMIIINSSQAKNIEKKLKKLFTNENKTKILNFSTLFDALKNIILKDLTKEITYLVSPKNKNYKNETKILKKEIKTYIKTSKEINIIKGKEIFNNSDNTIKPISTIFHEMGHALFNMLYHENRGELKLLGIPLRKMQMRLYNKVNESQTILTPKKEGALGLVVNSNMKIIENDFKCNLAGYFSQYILDIIINNKNPLGTLLFIAKQNDGDMKHIKKTMQEKEKYNDQWVQKMIQETFDTLISVRSAQILYTLYIWNGEHQDPHNELPKIYTQKHENNIEYDLEKTIYFNKNFNPFLNANDLDYLIQSTTKMIDNYQKRYNTLTIQEKQILALAKYALKFENLKDSYTFITKNQHLQEKSFKEKLSDFAFDYLA